MNDKNKNKKTGFTMIEILIVIAIIGFIAAAASYLFVKAREDARIVKAKGHASFVNSKLGSNMIGWWSFDETPNNNTSINDSWAINNGCIVGSADRVTGMFGKAFYFNGGTEADLPASGCGGAQINGTLSPAITSDDVTITSWFKTSGVGTIVAIGTDRAFGLINTVGSDYGKISAPKFGSTAKSNKAYNDDKWHFAAVKMGKSGTKIWVDGVLVGENTTSLTDLTTCCGFIVFGVGQGGAWNYFSGAIDEVKLYNESLTAQEIQKLYADSMNKYLAIK